ncbi:MAG: hypothetical protein ACC682_12905, partial [Gemmatimonadota bacterium]
MQLVSRVAKAGVLHDPATLFNSLAGDLRDRTTPPLSRLILGVLTLLVTVGITIGAILLHRAGRRRTG